MGFLSDWGWEQYYPYVQSLAKAALLFVVGWIAISVALTIFSRFFDRKHPNAALHAFMMSLLRIGARIILLTSCLDMIGIPVGSILTTLGALGLALSLSMQDSLSNLAQGVVILFSQPFKLGDYVEIDALGGIVERIDLLHVILYTTDRKRIYISNSQVVKAKITNYSASEERRLDLSFTIQYNDDLERTKEIIHEVVTRHPRVLTEPQPTVRLSDINGNNLQIACLVWTKNESFWTLRYDLLEQVREALLAEKARNAEERG